MRSTCIAAVGGGFLLLALAGVATAQTTITLEPAKDNTLYEDPNGSFSNGEGESIFAGRTFFAGLRRAVLAFDVAASVPAGAIITSASLRLAITREPPGAAEVVASLHALTADWGEAASVDLGPGGLGVPSMPGDATWRHRFFEESLWDAPGGDFAAAPSADALIAPLQGAVIWGSTPELVADVQAWLDNPAGNFGWILRVSESTEGSARRFASRENVTLPLRPALTLTFDPPADCPADFNHDGAIDPDDLGDFINCYFALPPCDRADFNHDGAIDPDDLGDFINTYFSSTPC